MEKDFRFFDLSLPARLSITAALYALGALLGALTGAIFPALLVAATGWVPLMLRKATNRPDDQGLEEWRLVGIAEIDRLDEGIRASRRARKKAARIGTRVAAVFLVPFVFVSLIASAALGRNDAQLFLLLALVYLVPALFFGRVKVFVPPEIDQKMPSFRALLAEKQPAAMAFAPYIRFDKDGKGRDVPEDLRLLLEPRRKPEDLVGIQFQAAINKGPNGPVPYLYAVVLTKGKEGPSWKEASRLTAKGFEVEGGGDAGYGTVVIRQDTGGGGYYTSPEDCRKLARLCFGLLGKLAS